MKTVGISLALFVFWVPIGAMKNNNNNEKLEKIETLEENKKKFIINNELEKEKIERKKTDSISKFNEMLNKKDEKEKNKSSSFGFANNKNNTFGSFIGKNDLKNFQSFNGNMLNGSIRIEKDTLFEVEFLKKCSNIEDYTLKIANRQDPAELLEKINLVLERQEKLMQRDRRETRLLRGFDSCAGAMKTLSYIVILSAIAVILAIKL